MPRRTREPSPARPGQQNLSQPNQQQPGSRGKQRGDAEKEKQRNKRKQQRQQREHDILGSVNSGSSEVTRPRQSFENWQLDGGAPDANCLNLFGALHTKNSSASAYEYRRLDMNDTLVLHHGMLSAWFFVSKQSGKVLCKNKSNLVVEEILSAFSACEVRDPEVRPKDRNVAVLFRGNGFMPQYLTESDLTYFLQHKAINDRCAVIQKLGPYNNDEFSVLHATWMSGHIVVDGKRYDSEHSPFSYIRIEERMKALDAFMSMFSPNIIYRDPKALAYVTESWTGAKVMSRLRAMCSGIVRHIDSVCKTHSVKKFRCFFKLGMHNQISFMFPVEIGLHPLSPPEQVVNKVAMTIYKVPSQRRKWNLENSSTRKNKNKKIVISETEATKPRNHCDVNYDDESPPELNDIGNGDTKEEEKKEEEEAKSGFDSGPTTIEHTAELPSIEPKESMARPAVSTASYEFSKKSNIDVDVNSTVNVNIKTQKMGSRIKRSKPKAPAQPRRRPVNPVRKLLSAYGSSNTCALRMDEWWTRRQKLDRAAEKKRLQTINPSMSPKSPKSPNKPKKTGTSTKQAPQLQSVSSEDHIKFLEGIQKDLLEKENGGPMVLAESDQMRSVSIPLVDKLGGNALKDKLQDPQVEAPIEGPEAVSAAFSESELENTSIQSTNPTCEPAATEQMDSTPPVTEEGLPEMATDSTQSSAESHESVESASRSMVEQSIQSALSELGRIQHCQTVTKPSHPTLLNSEENKVLRQAIKNT